ncbi:MAG: DNA polymerase III subunit delta' [Gammaproteobacteria bacterium]|nr:MAG: DNA polymerase III subunit delta' [Gammaproteobacteria bacterium]
MSEALLPWLRSPWRRLSDQKVQGRLPHALLITGLPGMGKGLLADALARLMLCQAPRDTGEGRQACGSCESCTLLDAETHPDFRRLGVPEGKQQIPVDEVRGLIEFVQMSSQFRGARVAMIEPADALNVASANALLKTLEEPPPDALLILVSSRPSRLPVTIRSRCQRLHLAPPSAVEVAAWLRARQAGVEEADLEKALAIAHGAPLAAAELLESDALARRDALFDDLFSVLRGQMSVSTFSGRFEGQYDSRLLGWIGDWLHDLALLSLTENPPDLRAPDKREDLLRLAKALDLKRVFSLHSRVQEALRLLGQVAVNPQLALEALLVEWQDALNIRQR